MARWLFQPTALAAIFAACGAFASDRVGDADAGLKVFSECRACHQVGQGARNRVGPHLNGIFGRKAGTNESFRYSKSMTRAGSGGLIWTVETLDAFIENPRAMVSNTRMGYSGLKGPADRIDLLAYLRRFSDDPADLLEVEPTPQATDHGLDPAIFALEGDAEHGEYLSSECLTCHQSDGSAEGIPSIARWPIESFVVAMHAYKNKLRPHPVMQMLAGRLNDEEIAALAAYFKDLD